MNKTMKNLLMLTLLFSGFPVLAMEMDHSMMKHDNHKMASESPMSLETLARVPASGISREGGFDGRYVMESTDISDASAERCAQASRGLVMLDEAGWAQCDRKPKGLVAVENQMSEDSKNTKEAVMDSEKGHHMHM